MLPMRFFRKPDVRARERLVAVHVLRDVRLDLPALAVLPDRAGLLAAQRRACGSCRGRSRRCSSPRSRARCRTGSRGRRSSGSASRSRRSALAWMGLVSTPTVAYSELIAPFVLAGIGMSLFFAPVANIVLSAVRPEEEGQASGRQQRDPRARRRVRRRRSRVGLRAAFGGYESGQAFIDGMNPALIIGGIVVALGAVAAFAIPGRPRTTRGGRRRASCPKSPSRVASAETELRRHADERDGDQGEGGEGAPSARSPQRPRRRSAGR